MCVQREDIKRPIRTNQTLTQADTTYNSFALIERFLSLKSHIWEAVTSIINPFYEIYKIQHWTLKLRQHLFNNSSLSSSTIYFNPILHSSRFVVKKKRKMEIKKHSSWHSVLFIKNYLYHSPIPLHHKNPSAVEDTFLQNMRLQKCRISATKIHHAGTDREVDLMLLLFE